MVGAGLSGSALLVCSVSPLLAAQVRADGVLGKPRQLLRSPFGRSSQNPPSTRSDEQGEQYALCTMHSPLVSARLGAQRGRSRKERCMEGHQEPDLAAMNEREATRFLTELAST